MNGPRPYFALYELIAGDGTVLYVGATKDIATRLRSHRRTKEWWPEVDHAKVVECADFDQLAAREKQRIIELKPRYNHRLLGKLESTDLLPLYEPTREVAS